LTKEKTLIPLDFVSSLNANTTLVCTHKEVKVLILTK